MGKTIKRRTVKRRKTRRRKLTGGRDRKSKVALYVWKNLDDKTFQKRIFVEDDGTDYTDWITDAGYNLRWLAGEGGNTIPRKSVGVDKYQDIKPYVKYMTADYSEGDVDETAKVVEKPTDDSYTRPPPSAPPLQLAGDLNNKIAGAFKDVKRDELAKIAKNLGISSEQIRSATPKDKLIQLIVEKLVRQ
jgi:hypothetical protein